MMKTIIKAAALAAFFLSSAAMAADAAPVIAAGSGVNLGITRLLAEAFMRQRPDVKIEVPPSIGTGGAIKAAKEGAVSLGLTSRPLKPKEREEGLREEAYARVPLVIAAHASVPDEALSSQEIAAIYKGQKTKWSDGSEIIVLTREPHDSGFLILQEKVPGFKEAYEESYQKRLWTIFFNDQEANEGLSTTKQAIGVTDLGMIATEKLNAKPLKLDGVMPSPETLANGTYPMERTLFFLYKEKTLSPCAKAFLDFVHSAEGQAILRANGYLPVGADGR